jgi:hypothetical protein
VKICSKFLPALVLTAVLASLNTSADTIYVSGSLDGSSEIAELTSAGVSGTFAFSNVGDAQGVAFDNAGNLYEANESASAIEKFTPAAIRSVFASGTEQSPWHGFRPHRKSLRHRVSW